MRLAICDDYADKPGTNSITQMPLQATMAKVAEYTIVTVEVSGDYTAGQLLGLMATKASPMSVPAEHSSL
jgi:hypothetical protein